MTIDVKKIMAPVTERWGPEKTFQITTMSLVAVAIMVCVGDIMISDDSAKELIKTTE